MKLYIKSDCDFCNQVVVPSELNVEVVDVDTETYTGFKPDQVPVLQTSNLNFGGPEGINQFLNLSIDIQNGKYKR